MQASQRLASGRAAGRPVAAFGSRPAARRTVLVQAAVPAAAVSVPKRSADGEDLGSEQLALKVAKPETAKGLVHRYLVYVQQNARRVRGG